MPNFSDLFANGGVKSIQRGEAVMTLAVGAPVYITISAVNLSKATLNVVSIASSQSGTVVGTSRVILSSATKIKVEATSNVGGNTYVSWEVIEFL